MVMTVVRIVPSGHRCSRCPLWIETALSRLSAEDRSWPLREACRPPAQVPITTRHSSKAAARRGVVA